MSATIVIGDLHGCADEFQALLRACGYVAGDQVVLVGDLVAKGPDSRGVLAIARECGARSVLGNHDAKVLRLRDTLAAGDPVPPSRIEHAAIAGSLTEQEWAQLSSLPYWLRLPELNALVVHGGLVPGVAIEQQDPDVLMNVRTLDAHGNASRRPDGGVLWGSVWTGPELVLFGHHAGRGLQEHPYALGIDTACVYGRELTACVFPERRLVSVPARRQYAPIVGGPA